MRYWFIEDNGGGLHLLIFDNSGKAVAGITDLEYAPAGEWDKVKNGLSTDALAEVKTWGHMDDNGVDPQEFFEEVMASDDYEYAVVCNSGQLYPDGMGAAAQRYFGIDMSKPPQPKSGPEAPKAHPTFFVTRRAPCPECEGTGMVEHRAWTQYCEMPETDDWDDAKRDAWFMEEWGYGYPPDQEISCPECNGGGAVEKEVTLTEALEEIEKRRAEDAHEAYPGNTG